MAPDGQKPSSGITRIDFAPVERELNLFRFLDFTKYVSMLDQHAVFFTRADQLADPFEGAYPRGSRVLESDREQDGSLRRSVLLHCWHANEHESVAMWRIYLKSEEGVAIQTTTDRLQKAFGPMHDQAFIGAVRYLDYQRDCLPEAHELGPFFCKRKAFEYEREVRVVLRASEPCAERGRYVAADLTRLIERVVISPSAESWFEKLVRSVTRRCGFELRIERSELGCEP
jgi:hypothetical protein